MAVTTTNLDYMLPYLRLRIGDTTSGSYRYTDEWLQTALVASVMALQPFWSKKYVINHVSDTEKNVERNTGEWVYAYTDPPIVQDLDMNPIVIMAAIITLEGSLESFSWGLGSWKDAEISYSNIASGKSKDGILSRLWAQLDDYLIAPTKRLKGSIKGSLPGYRKNKHESKLDY